LARVAVEEPGYFGVHRALEAGGAEIVPVPVDDEGLNVAALSRRAGKIRAVYVTPSHHYPLGVTMSAARRFALLDWAAREDAWILEDDYDAEFRYVSRPVGALQGMDTRDRVVYIGTFSKAFCPAVRLGYIVVPPTLWADFFKRAPRSTSSRRRSINERSPSFCTAASLRGICAACEARIWSGEMRCCLASQNTVVISCAFTMRTRDSTSPFFFASAPTTKMSLLG
jgi:aspartate/methionine/tyrosine aminotransferase